jgi:hypothetical protein
MAACIIARMGAASPSVVIEAFVTWTMLGKSGW